MIPVQITLKDVPGSKAIEQQIRKRARKLAQFYKRITSCHVVIAVPQKHKHKGKLFTLRIAVNVPGKELVVSKKQNQDLYLAIRDSFNALERQIENYHAPKFKTYVDAAQMRKYPDLMPSTA